jgi:chemosensory pili system protein ChpA (sensor histidine kinase/response regulator)
MPPCVLVVDDDRPTQTIVAEILTEVGCEVLLASNGAEALWHLRDRVPDVLITDLEMPVLNGWTLVELCRTEPALKHVPIVVLTAQTAPSLALLAHLDVQHVVAKPFDIRILIDTITSLVAA